MGRARPAKPAYLFLPRLFAEIHVKLNPGSRDWNHIWRFPAYSGNYTGVGLAVGS